MLLNKTWKTTVVIVSALMVPAMVHAQEGWTWSLGAGYRDFEDVDFQPYEFRNYNRQQGNEQPIGIQGYTGAQFPGGFAAVRADFVKYTGDDKGAESAHSLAPVLTLEKAFGAREDIMLSWVCNLQFYEVEVDKNDVGTSGNEGQFDAYNAQYNTGGGFIEVTPGSAARGLTAGTAVALRNTFDLDMLVLDFGVKAALPKGRVQLFAAAGPTLSLTDLETTQTESANWTPANANDPGRYNRTREDSEFRFIPGAYAAVGAGIDLNECTSVSAEVRYDWALNDPSTAHAKMDLDGGTVLIKLSWCF